VSHQAAFAAFFFTLRQWRNGSVHIRCECVNAAQRLICACRMRSRASALILWRFLGLLNLRAHSSYNLREPAGLTLGTTAPDALNSALACSRQAISLSIAAGISFTMVRLAPPQKNS